MMRRPSLSLRALRAAVGLVTVWCLGCSAFEPLLGSLIGSDARAAMSCAGSEMAQSESSAARQTDKDVSKVTVASSAETFDCGCGSSCHAPSPTHWVAATPATETPRVDVWTPCLHCSESRTPLLPPPERAA